MSLPEETPLVASSSSSSSSSQEYEDQLAHQPGQRNGVPFGGCLFLYDPSVVTDDTCSYVAVVLSFWLFLSMTVIFGVYGPSTLSLGPDSSVCVDPNPLFVQSMKVEELDYTSPGLKLYGFYRSPPLDVVKNWSKTYNVSVQAESHKEWLYFLNEESEINISYNVTFPESNIFLVIAEGKGELARWLDDPARPNSTFSWNVVQGSGFVQQKVWRSSFYYVAVCKLSPEKIQMEINIKVRALVYNTSGAYYKCSFANGACSLNVLFPTGNAAVLTSPSSEEGSTVDHWNVRISYGPRWATYILGITSITVLMVVAFKFMNKLPDMHEAAAALRFRELASERAPLIPQKDEDLWSWGSSYDSVSSDEANPEEFVAGNCPEGKSAGNGENGNNTRRLCAVCFDAPRECFFLPCGHCVACFDCGTRIAEAAGTCPICQRNTKKVRKIFTV